MAATSASRSKAQRPSTALSASRDAQLKRDVQSLAQRADKLTNQAKVAAFHRLA